MSVATEYATPGYVPVPVPVHAPARGPARRPVQAPGRLASVTVLVAPRERSGVAAPIRLTRRGVVVLTLAVVALGAALVWLAGVSGASAPAGPAPAPATVTVTPGDTLWSIAGRVAPQRDPRDEVAALQRANHLAGVELVPGQVLRVP